MMWPSQNFVLYNGTIMSYSFLLSLTHIKVEKVLFLGEIFELEIKMDLHVMRTPEFVDVTKMHEI